MKGLKSFSLILCFCLVPLMGCGSDEVQPPPAPAANPDGGGAVPPAGGAPQAGGGPVASPAPGAASQSTELPPSSDPALQDREKFRMKKREEARKLEEEDKKRTLIVTEHPIFDSKLGRRDPFAEVNPYNNLSPLVGFTINQTHYRVTGLSIQGKIKRASIQMGLNTLDVPTTRVVEEGEGFFEDYNLIGKELTWKGRKVVDGQVLPNNEVVDEVKVRQNMILVTEINFQNQYVILRELPTDKYPARQIKLTLKSFTLPESAAERASGVNVGDPSDNDDYIKYLEEKTGGKKNAAEDFGSFLQNEKTRRSRGRDRGNRVRNEPGMPPENAPPPPPLPQN